MILFRIIFFQQHCRRIEAGSLRLKANKIVLRIWGTSMLYTLRVNYPIVVLILDVLFCLLLQCIKQCIRAIRQNSFAVAYVAFGLILVFDSFHSSGVFPDSSSISKLLLEVAVHAIYFPISLENFGLNL